MHVWRLVLALLLSVAIPVYGMGSVGVHDDCPAKMHAVGAEAATMAGSCCDSMDGHGNGANDACSKLCSVSGDCRSASLVQASANRESSVTFHLRLYPRAIAHITALDPSGVWRPPRIL